MADETGSAAAAAREGKQRLRRSRQALRAARGHLTKRALHLIGFAVFVFLFLKLIPGFEKALTDLQNVNFLWVIGAMAIETLSEVGYVVSWRGNLDPRPVLPEGDRGKQFLAPGAWAHLGGGLDSAGG